MHDDAGVGALDFDADVRSGLDCSRLGGPAQGDRHKRLCSIDQYALAMFAQPAVHDVSVDAMLHCHPGNGRAGLGACADNLQSEFGTVGTPLGAQGGASLARNGVHDVHRAHYLWISAVLKCVLAGRIP